MTNFYVWNTMLSPNAWDPICITEFNGPSGAVSVIDVTTLGITEKLRWMPDKGQFSINGSFLPDDTGKAFLQTLCDGRKLGCFRCSLDNSQSSHIIFFGYVLSFQITDALYAKVKGRGSRPIIVQAETFSATIEISGKPSFT
jgi:hypothetical protein